MHAKRKQVEVPPCTKPSLVLHGHVTNASRDSDHDVCLKVAYKDRIFYAMVLCLTIKSLLAHTCIVFACSPRKRSLLHRVIRVGAGGCSLHLVPRSSTSDREH